jgi:hypothetical protein
MADKERHVSCNNKNKEHEEFQKGFSKLLLV